MQEDTQNTPQSRPFPIALQDTCCRIFVTCVTLSPSLLIRLINTLFGKDLPLDSEVHLGWSSAIETIKAGNPSSELNIVDMSPHITVRTPFGYTGHVWKTTFHECLLEFQPQYSSLYDIPVGEIAINRGYLSRWPEAHTRVTEPCAASVFVRDTPEGRRGMIKPIIDTMRGTFYMYPIHVVTLYRQSLEEIADNLTLLLPFAILRPYDQILNAPEDLAHKMYQTCYQRILQAATAKTECNVLSPEDCSSLLDCTRYLARTAYGDHIPSLKSEGPEMLPQPRFDQWT